LRILPLISGPSPTRAHHGAIAERIEKNLFAGLVVVVPIVITALALIWLFNFLDGFLSPFLKQTLGIDFAGVGLLTEIVLIFLVD